MSFWKRRFSRRHSRGETRKEDRRNMCRYPATTHASVIGWRDGESMAELPAYLENLSSEGCKVRSNRPPVPKPGEPIWFKAPSIDPFHWIAGTLVSTGGSLLGKRIIRIRFLAPLPYDTFKFLVYGPDCDREPPRRSSIPSYESDNLWR